MKTIDLLKLVLVLVALAIWAYGVRTGNTAMAFVGIAFVVIAFLLRFIQRFFR